MTAIEQSLVHAKPQISRTERRSRRWNVVLHVALATQVIAIIFGLMSNVFFNNQIRQIDRSFYSPLPTATIGKLYQTDIPGPDCDPQPGLSWWSASRDIFQCRANGLIMTNISQTDIDAMRFEPNLTDPRQYFGSIFTMRVQATFVDAPSDACVGLEIDLHIGSANSHDFFVCADRSWNIDRSTNNGLADGRLAAGFLTQKASTHELQVAVRGKTLSFSIDQQPVATFVDQAYFATDSIALLLSGSTSTGASSTARFTHFAIIPDLTATPLPDASATPASTSAPYTAAVPGFGCDHGGAPWSSPEYGNGTGAAFTCQTNRFVIQQLPQNARLAQELFYGRDGMTPFPTNYSVSVQLDLSLSPSACAGLDMRRQLNDFRGYGFYMCRNGAALIVTFPAAGGTATVLSSGPWKYKPSVVLVVTVRGSILTLSLDGKTLLTATDASLTTTDHIDLGVYASDAHGASAGFSRFVFTPLPKGGAHAYQ